MPKEFMGWPDHVRETFKIEPQVNTEIGMSREEVIRSIGHCWSRLLRPTD
jgi:hypothetical protein